MPKKTFFNLKNEKKNKIIEVSIDEFAKYAYTDVSINQIIKKSKIPRGSFYQYFNDKEDLYLFIIKLINNEKLKLINEVTEKNEKRNFQNECAKIFEVSIGMAIKYPKYNKIFNNMDLDISKFIGKLKESDESTKRILTRLIKEEQESGKIKKNINPTIISNVIFWAIKEMSKQDFTKDSYKDSIKDFKEVLDIILNGVLK